MGLRPLFHVEGLQERIVDGVPHEVRPLGRALDDAEHADPFTHVNAGRRHMDEQIHRLRFRAAVAEDEPLLHDAIDTAIVRNVRAGEPHEVARDDIRGIVGIDRSQERGLADRERVLLRAGRRRAGCCPREARIAAQRERERTRQAARETARERSRMTRAEYVAPAHRRRAEAQEMRELGISVREIAGVLAVSVREVYRLLGSVAMKLMQPAGGSSVLAVQGSPGLSDFVGGSVPVEVPITVAMSSDCDENNNKANTSQPSTAHGGAIASAIVSEYEVRARSAQPESDVAQVATEETNVAESPIAYIQRRIREIVVKNRDRERPP
jgi:hypothetical protein